MPLDVLGRTRDTMIYNTMSLNFAGLRGLANLCKIYHIRDRCLQLFILNEEHLVRVSHQLTLNTSLPFVHTARRTYRLNDEVKKMESRITSVFLFTNLLNLII